MMDLFGQVLCVGVPEDGLSRGFCSFFKEYLPANFILFRRNTAGGPEALRELTQGLVALCSQYRLPRPIICVDQEGGDIARLGPPHWPRLPWFGELDKRPDPRDAVLESARQTAKMLKEVGINVNLAPCLDLTEDDSPTVMHCRTLSSDPVRVAELGVHYIEELGKHGVAAVAKHFPGIGAIDEDPHHDFSMSTSSKERQRQAMLPFRAAIRAGVFGIMTSHVLYPDQDPGNIATFSRSIIGILRRELEFQGVVFTDDLFMGAIRRNRDGYGLGRSGLLAIEAGHDMLLYCGEMEITATAIEELRRNLEKDRTIREHVLQTSKRIIRVKREYLGES